MSLSKRKDGATLTDIWEQLETQGVHVLESSGETMGLIPRNKGISFILLTQGLPWTNYTLLRPCLSVHHTSSRVP